MMKMNERTAVFERQNLRKALMPRHLSSRAVQRGHEHSYDKSPDERQDSPSGERRTFVLSPQHSLLPHPVSLLTLDLR